MQCMRSDSGDVELYASVAGQKLWLGVADKIRTFAGFGFGTELGTALVTFADTSA